MRVKKFEAKNMKEALQMVKNELGPDAVILAARDNRKFGLGGQTSVEITAAVSESTLHKKRFAESRLTAGDRARFQNSDARTQRSIIDRMVESRQAARDGSEKGRPNPRQVLAQAIQAQSRQGQSQSQSQRQEYPQAQAQSQTQVQVQAQTQAQQFSNPRRSITTVSYIDIPDFDLPDDGMDVEIESGPRRKQAFERAAGRNVADLLQGFEQDFTPAVAPSIASSPVAAMEPAGAVNGRETEIVTLKNEISRLQKLLEGFQKVPQTFVTMHPGADFGLPYDLSFMFQKLTEAGVTVDNTVDILRLAAKEIDPIQLKKRPIVDAWIARWLLDNVHVVPSPFQGRLHLFVGGAGSGKTSQLVKMASHLVVREKKKIAILSTDSFKVGAVDQLKIYCQILNVPFAVIRNKKDWEWVLGQLRHVDHFLVDFPGLQLRDLDEIHLLKSLLPPEGSAPICHFCLSATTKDGDAYEIARRYRTADYGDLVFTNLDQSVQHGIIHNLQKKTGKPLHSFGIGNRIPEDFEIASKERVLDLIFKLSRIRKP